MRKRDDTLRDTLLAHARQMAAEGGTDAVNIRALAAQAGVSVGTVYNYFTGKDDILLALTEDTWRDILQDLRMEVPDGPFVQQVGDIYAFLLARMRQSAGMLMHSLREVEQAGRARMETMQQVLRKAVLERMARDPAIRPALWQGAFTREAYADFIIMNLMTQLRMGAQDIGFFLEILKRTLY